MKSTDSHRPTTALQKAFLLLFGIFLVVLLEGALRIAGVGGSTSLYVKSTDRYGREVYVSNQALNRRLFFPVTGADSNFPRPQMPHAVFSVKKEPGTFRFFTVGASSSVAMPFAPNVAFNNYLREMIAAGMPGRKVEAINTSMTAVSSYQVAQWVDEILDRYDPDLVVVYTGHNEFYGVLGAGSAMSVGSNRALTLLFQRVQETALYALVAAAIEKVKSPPEDSPKAQPLESLTKNREIRVDSPVHRAAEKSFGENLDHMARHAEERGTPIFFCTPASNRAACSPMEPMHREDFPASSAAGFDRMLQAGDSWLRLGDLEKAGAEYAKAEAEDSTHADALYRLGVVAAERGEWADARRHFDDALLFDGVRLRASERIVDAIRRVAKEHEKHGLVHLVDVIRRFEDDSPGGLVGSNLILEHIHMNGRGHYLAAAAIYDALLGSGLFPAMTDAGGLSFDEAAKRVGYGPLDRAYAASFMQVMLRRWPFKGTFGGENQIRFMDARLREAREELDPVERQVFDSHPAGATVLHLYHRVGVAYLEAGDFDKAAERFRLITSMLPRVPEPWVLLAESLARGGHEAEAKDALAEALFCGLDRTAVEKDNVLAKLF